MDMAVRRQTRGAMREARSVTGAIVALVVLGLIPILVVAATMPPEWALTVWAAEMLGALLALAAVAASRGRL